MKEELLKEIKISYKCTDEVAKRIFELAASHDVPPVKSMIELLEFKSKIGNTYTPMLTIAALRRIAQSAGWAGNDPVVFSDTLVSVPVSEWANGSKQTGGIQLPEWGYMVLYKLVQGQVVKFVGPKLYAKETAQDKSMWKTKPIFMFEKNIEAAALRRAFPEKLTQDYISDEYVPESIHIDSTGLDALSAVQAEPEAEPVQANEPTLEPKQNKQKKKATVQDVEDFRVALANCATAEEFDEVATIIGKEYSFTIEQKKILAAARKILK